MFIPKKKPVPKPKKSSWGLLSLPEKLAVIVCPFTLVYIMYYMFLR